jgi:hypothetical protein
MSNHDDKRRGLWRRGALLGAFLYGLLTLATAPAGADETTGSDKLVIAMYAPTAPLPSAEARFAFVEKLAQRLQSSGIPAEGKVYAKQGDLESAIKKGQVDLAILDGFYLAERGASYPVLAVSLASGEQYLRWGLYTHLPTGSILDMSGKRLAWVSPSGSQPTYITNALLYGELKAQFFQLRPAAPDLSAAVSEVVLRRADCVFAPEVAVAGKQLRRAYDAGDAGRIPNPALVQISQKLPEATVANIKKAVGGFNTTGVFDGWRVSGGIGDAYRTLRQHMRGRAERSLVMAEPQRLNTLFSATLVQPVDATPVLPALRSLVLAPEGIP